MNEAIAIILFGIGISMLCIGAGVICADPVRDIGKGFGYVGIGFVFMVGCFLTVYFKVM